LYRVLMNLIRNAVQALEASPGGVAGGVYVRRLTVEADRQGSVARIRVVDTGPGLPPAAREKLFKPFQGSASPGGTGLGLAIAAELVRAHGGSITLLGDGPGATFQIEIPDRPVDLTSVRHAGRAS